jgi:hypothetical protein
MSRSLDDRDTTDVTLLWINVVPRHRNRKNKTRLASHRRRVGTIGSTQVPNRRTRYV